MARLLDLRHANWSPSDTSALESSQSSESGFKKDSIKTYRPARTLLHAPHASVSLQTRNHQEARDQDCEACCGVDALTMPPRTGVQSVFDTVANIQKAEIPAWPGFLKLGSQDLERQPE